MRKPPTERPPGVLARDPHPPLEAAPKRSARLQSKGARRAGTPDSSDAAPSGDFNHVFVAGLGRSGLASSGQLSGMSSLDIVAAVACAQSAQSALTATDSAKLRKLDRKPVNTNGVPGQPEAKRVKTEPEAEQTVADVQKATPPPPPQSPPPLMLDRHCSPEPPPPPKEEVRCCVSPSRGPGLTPLALALASADSIYARRPGPCAWPCRSHALPAIVFWFSQSSFHRLHFVLYSAPLPRKIL